MTDSRHRETARAVADLIEQHYVLADVATELAALLRDRADAGSYASVAREVDLAARITADLQSITNDKHLRLLHHAEPLVDLADPGLVAAAHLKQAEAASYGVSGPTWVEGRLAVVRFSPLLFHPSVSGAALTTAMQAVADARGLVLDLRDCRGGAPSAVCLVLTYLLGPEVHLTDLEARDPADLHQLWTLPWVPGPMVPDDVPVAVCTSSATFSGAEDLAYTLQAHRRAIVVGETTGGGAHPRHGFRVTEHLEVTIPVARAVSRVTGSNWEGVGVVPDVDCPATDALDRALAQLTDESVRPG
ncbi:MAG: S41 family peptidase [Aeromicrobium sp.]